MQFSPGASLDHWVRDYKHVLSQNESDQLLFTLLRVCACNVDVYKLALNDLIQLSVLNGHNTVKE